MNTATVTGTLPENEVALKWMSYFLTADNFRPYITSFQGNNCTDYINAVFVDVSQSNPSVMMHEDTIPSSLMYYAKSNYETEETGYSSSGGGGKTARRVCCSQRLSVLCFHQPLVHFLSIFNYTTATMVKNSFFTKWTDFPKYYLNIAKIQIL